uniref:X-ray radiation resistance-associated protein 1 n=1 Tax=Salvator merianae TaxID=96440 RepID=A0A8D0BGZ4_SALMN
MATKGIYKLDDGNCYPTNCFPARGLLRPRYDEGTGHWLVARRAAEQSKIEFLFGTRFDLHRFRGQLTPVGTPGCLNEKTLDGTQLMKLHHVRSPSDLCSVDISNQNFSSATEDDFEQFTSVAYINATENLLNLEVFHKFPGLRELELSLNGLRNLKISTGEFPHLEILDLSYNNLSPEDVQVLGILPRLKVLHLTANGLTSLPLDLAAPESSENSTRFPALEILLLDDNHLSHPNVFVSLASLRSLKQLNLDQNGIKEVPYLHHVQDARFSIHPLSAKSGIREGLRSRKSAGKHLRKDSSPGFGGQAEYIVFQSSKDPDRTEVLFPSWSPDPPAEDNSSSPRNASKVSCASCGPDFTFPLPELRFLSLANNQIEHEEDLLAVALFPSLTELTFYGNPFTTSRRGDPPLLTSFLQNKLGIKLVRQKVSKLEKPRLLIPNKANRKVKTRLPKIRKRSLMLEAPVETTFWQLWTGADLDPNQTLNVSEPLPSIRSLSISCDLELPVISVLQKEAISVSISLSSFDSEENLAENGSSDQPFSASQTSLDHLLLGSTEGAESSRDQILFQSLPPCGSFLEEHNPPGFAGLMEALSGEEGLSEPLQPEEDLSKPSPDIRAPSEGEDLSENIPLVSLPLEGQDQLAPAPPLSPSLEGQDLPEILQPLSCAVGQEQLHPDTPPAPSLLQQVPLGTTPATDSLKEEQKLSESLPPVGSISEKQDLREASVPSESLTGGQDQTEPTPASGSTSQGPDVSEAISTTGSLAQGPPEIPPPPISSAEEQDQAVPAPSSAPTSREGAVSESYHSKALLPTTYPAEGQDRIMPSSPSTPLLPAQDLPGPLVLASSLTRLQPLPPVMSPPAGQDHLELASLSGPPQQELEESKPVLPTQPPSKEQVLPPSVRPSAERPASWPSEPTKLPSVEQVQPEPVLAAVPTFQEPESEEPELYDGSRLVPQESLQPPATASSSFKDHIRREGIRSSEFRSMQEASGKLLSPSSVSRELYLLFAQAHSDRKSLGRLGSFSSEDELRSDSKDFVETEQSESESFFMTQVDEAPSSPLKPILKEPPFRHPGETETRGTHLVPEKYKGYELLLGGTTDPDFIEPVGIQHNVQALDRALRCPRVYRDSKARLDSYQKPYRPSERKALRVPLPPKGKTKMQRLEEILLKMREPTNIIELPLGRYSGSSESQVVSCGSLLWACGKWAPVASSRLHLANCWSSFSGEMAAKGLEIFTVKIGRQISNPICQPPDLKFPPSPCMLSILLKGYYELQS